MCTMWCSNLQVMTGAVYDILSDIFEMYKKDKGTRPDDYWGNAQLLCAAGYHLYKNLITAYKELPEKNVRFHDVATGMLKTEQDSRIQDIMRARWADTFQCFKVIRMRCIL